jgi:hypothetical protein
MDAWREVQRAMAAWGLGWGDIWLATVDRREGRVVLITMDGRKFSQPLGARPTGSRTKMVKGIDN